MAQFGELLKQILTEQGYSVSSFSRLASLDRGWLYAIFSGKRKLPESNLQNILEGSFFTQENAERLRQAYYQEIYGKDQMERILFLQRRFSDLCHPADMAPAELPLMAEVLPESGYLGSMPEVLGAAYHLIRETQSLSDASPELCTNLPYYFPTLDQMLLQSFRQGPPDYRLHRIVPLLQNGAGTYNLEKLFASLQYLGKPAHLWYYYTAQIHTALPDQIFPFYLIAPKGVLLIHQDGRQGLLVREEGFCAKMRDSFQNSLKSCTEMTYFYDSALSFLSNSHEAQSADYAVELGNAVTLLLNRALLEQYGSSRFTGVRREWIISSLLGFLSQQSSSSQDNKILLSKQNILDFLQTGVFPNIPREYLNPLSPEHRLELLGRMEIHLKNHPQQSLGLLDQRIFGEYSNHFSISLARKSNSVIFCGQKQPRTGQSFVGECGLQISNAVLYHDFLYFFDYAQRNHYIYDTENSLAVLRQLSLGAAQKDSMPQPASQQPPAAEEYYTKGRGGMVPAL